MANNHINELIATDELFQLIQKENFVGWVFSLDYDNAFSFPQISLIANSILYTGLTFFFKNIIAQSHSVCNRMRLHA